MFKLILVCCATLFLALPLAAEWDREFYGKYRLEFALDSGAGSVEFLLNFRNEVTVVRQSGEPSLRISFLVEAGGNGRIPTVPLGRLRGTYGSDEEGTEINLRLARLNQGNDIVLAEVLATLKDSRNGFNTVFPSPRVQLFRWDKRNRRYETITPVR